MAYRNKVSLENGNVLLYTREGAKKQIYTMRVYVRGLTDIVGNKKQYIIESTGESNKEQAIRVALERYDEVKSSKRYGLPSQSLKFAEIFEQWFETKKQNVRWRRSKWFRGQYNAYWFKYFGDSYVDALQPRDFEAYWEWRQSYWKRFVESGGKKPPQATDIPSRKTLAMEQSALRQIFGWASSRKLTALQFDKSLIEHPYYRQSKKDADERRPSFSYEEWKTLDTYMRDVWVKGKAEGDQKVHKGHIYQRELARRLIQLIQSTGLRVGEAVHLRHRNIDVVAEDKRHVLHINVEDGKTGKRIVKTLPTAVRYYQAICDLTNHTDADDWLFANADGTQYASYEHAIRGLLRQVPYRNRTLYTSDDGKRRSLTSFRHYYAEERVRASEGQEGILQALANNMGTSRQMLDRHYVDKILVGDRQGLTRYPKRD